MEFLRIVLIVIGGAAVVIVLTAIISAFYNYQRNRERKRNKQSTPRKELDSFLKDNVFRRNVFSSLYYPVLAEGTVRTHHRQRIDEVVVTNAGILILTVFDKLGRIDNSKDDVWVVIHDDDRKEIESPLSVAEKCRSAIHSIMKRAGYGKVPIYSTVVIMNDETIPLAGNDDLIFMSELEKLLYDMKRTSALSKVEQFYISRILKNAGMTKEKIRKNKL